MNAERHTKPIVIVTGANGGVGLAVCQRLLLQLCQPVPRDSLPQKSIISHIQFDDDASVDFAGDANVSQNASEGLTLILACRNTQKAETARLELLEILDKEIVRIKRRKAENREKNVARATKLRENVVIAIEKLDLASLKSVFTFSTEIRKKYPYVSHVVWNAGVANFTGYDWPLAIKQLCTEFVTAVTRPLFKLQLKGQKSDDGFGLIMQSNVLGHYFLYRLLEPHLEAYYSRTSSSARVIWMSSLEADPSCYDPDDWQLLCTEKPYDASKYQIDLVAGHLEREQQRAIVAGEKIPIRHFIAHPGVVRTNIAISTLNSVVLDYCMQLAFLIAHCLGSTAHVWTPYKSAVSTVHLLLVALPFVTVASKNVPARPHVLDRMPTASDDREEESPVPLKFGAEVDFLFREYVGVTEVPRRAKMRKHGSELVDKFDKLFEEFAAKERER